MTDITPIQTEYNGHHFRSRLEARWAVFFDALGVRYEYEAEGYDLDGVWYLPDFWLPEVGCYVEIKPFDPSGEAEGLLLDEKALALALHARRYVLVIYGNPWPHEYGIALQGPGATLWFSMQFALTDRAPEQLWLSGKHGHICVNPVDGMRGYPDQHHSRLQDAYRAARSARFEHGERGRTL